MVVVERRVGGGFAEALEEGAVDCPQELEGEACGAQEGYHLIIIDSGYVMFPVVSFGSIGELYSSDPAPRYTRILDAFHSRFGAKPDFIARAPGRVNIIGEHIDYEGYGVLPAAIEKDCLIAVRKNNSQEITVHHVNSELYPSTVIPVDPEAPVQFADNYVKYFRAGYRAGVRSLAAEGLAGLEVVIEGNVPVAAGVSSSSALCVCSALAGLQANGGTVGSREEFIERVIAGERETGTASGGMDQSISVMGKTNFCLYIQFHPIRCTPVHLPAGSRFVVMNSLVESAKLNTAVFRYNKRVCECRLAVNIIAKRLSVPGKLEGGPHKILKELEDWSGLPLNSLGALVEAFLPRKDYSAQDIEELLGAPIESFLSDIQLYKEVLEANKTYHLYEAAKHVFDEAYRVINFQQVCQSQLQDPHKLVLLGKLMNESQTSCRDLYDCSCPEIDELTELARKNGAYGSRLTGAGWGGCTVSLVDAHHSQQFIKDMIEQHYRAKPELKEKIESIGIENIVFESLPSEGACLITFP